MSERAPGGPQLFRADGRIPVVLGVVGHRQIANPVLVRQRIESLLAHLTGEFGLSDSPLRGMSALADGADRLFAHTLLAAGIPILVPLPMPRGSYETDFDIDSREEFAALLNHPLVTWYELPMVGDNTEANTRDGGTRRDRQYASAGIHISKRSHILVAMWDGIDQPKLGGTSWVMRLRESRNLETLVNDPADWGALVGDQSLIEVSQHRQTYVIPVTRHEESAGRLADPHWRYVDGAFDSTGNLTLLNQYNGKIRTELPHLTPSVEPHNSSELSALHVLEGQLTTADTMAIQGVTRVRRTNVVIYVLAGIMALLVTVFGEFHLWELLVGYLGVASLIAILLKSMRRTRKSTTGEQYRALAEALRVQVYWQQLGVGETVASHYLHRHEGEIGWVLSALIGATPPHSPSPEPAVWNEIATGWFDGQSRYYGRRIHAYERRVRFLARLTRFSFTAAIVLTAVDAVFLATDYIGSHSSWQTVLRILTGMLFIGAGLARAYSETASTSEDIAQYRRMQTLFDRAAQECSALIHRSRQSSQDSSGSGRPNSDGIIRLLLNNTARRVGEEALREHADWALVHIAHEPKMPT